MSKRVSNFSMDKRLQRWGEWRTGARAYAPNVLARLRDGNIGGVGERLLIPFTDLEAWETNKAVLALPPDRQRLLRAVYPRTASRARELGLDVEALTSRLNDAHRMLGRVLKQRQAGESIDPVSRRRRLEVVEAGVTHEVDGRRVVRAAVQMDPA